MAQLPTIDILGARPTPQPARGVTSYRPGPTGAAAQADAITNLGATIQAITGKIVEARRAGQLHDAVGMATGQLGELELEFRRDQDFTTSPKRFTDRADLLRQKIEEGIEDSVVKQEFTRRFGELAQAKRLNVITHAAKQEGDFHVSRLDTTLDTFATAAANAGNLTERQLVTSQAELAIGDLRAAGWITDVDAGNRRRQFGQKVDQAIVTRDMTINAFDTALKLSTDGQYAAGLDPVARERLIDSGFRRAESERVRAENEANRERRARADEGMKNAWDALTTRSLTMSTIQQLRPDISDSEYRSLLEAYKKQGRSEDDNVPTYARLHSMLYPAGGGAPDFEQVRREATAALKAGEIKDSTYGALLSKAHDLTRQGGPRTPYERNRAFIVSSLEPSAMTMDPAPKARQGLATIEFDDWFASRSANPPTDAEARVKAAEVIKKYSLVDMNGLASKTGISGGDPSKTLQDIAAKGRKLQQDLAAKRISRSEFDKQMGELNQQRVAAERANGAGK